MFIKVYFAHLYVFNIEILLVSLGRAWLFLRLSLILQEASINQPKCPAIISTENYHKSTYTIGTRIIWTFFRFAPESRLKAKKNVHMSYGQCAQCFATTIWFLALKRCHLPCTYTDSFSSLRRADVAGCTFVFFLFICAMVGLRRKAYIGITKSNSSQTQQQHVGKQIRALRDACVARLHLFWMEYIRHLWFYKWCAIAAGVLYSL